MGRRMAARCLEGRGERRHRPRRRRCRTRHGRARLRPHGGRPRLLLALLRRGARGPGRHLPRAGPALPGRYVRLRDRRGPVQRVRLLRADERRRLRAHRPPGRGGQGRPGRADLRRRQLPGRVRPAHGPRTALRPHRRTLADGDRPGAGRARRARRAHPRRVRPRPDRVPRQGRRRALPLLAARRARGGPDPGVHAALRRHGRTRRLRRVAGLRHGLRRARRHSGGGS